MPTDDRGEGTANERYDGHRKSGGERKRQAKRKKTRRSVAEQLRLTVRERGWGRGRGD